MQVVGLVFSGIVVDFKEAERAPCLISSTVEGLDDAVTLFHMNRGIDGHADAFREHMLDMLDTLLLWLHMDDAELFYDVADKLSTMVASFAALEKTPVGGSMVTSRLIGEVNSIRLTLTRMRNIRETHYLPAARALMLVRSRAF